MIARVLTAAFFACAAPMLAWAQQEPVFGSYEEMRATLDPLMKSREIKRMMLRFGGADEIEQEQLEQLETRVRAIISHDLEHVDMLMRQDMGNGWAQELYAYWGGLSYIYVYVLLHDRGDEFVVINIKFNTDFDALVANF